MKINITRLAAVIGLSSLALNPVRAEETAKAADQLTTEKPKLSDQDLAKDLQNPVADVISVPLENRFDIGPGSNWRYTMTAQPVLPFQLTPDWLIVSRTLLPVISALESSGSPDFDNPGQSPMGTGPRVAGLGDITQSFFLAPKNPGSGVIWGAGPVLRLPTATRTSFGEGKWGAGPTGVILRQEGAWTYGMLANHIWSFAGWGPQNVSTTYLQPFLSYTTESSTTFGAGSETAYDWVNREWMVPIDISISQVVNIGKTPLQLGVGGRYYAVGPNGGPDWGLTFTITLLFPK